MRPARITAMRSASRWASYRSCVTSSARDWATSPDGAEHLLQIRARDGVERAERFVEQHHSRVRRERAGHRHALALTARELSRIAIVETASP